MKIATTNLTENEHTRFMIDLSLIECSGRVTITREGGVTTVSNKGDMPDGTGGMYSFCWSLKGGLLRALGYHKKFIITI